MKPRQPPDLAALIAEAEELQKKRPTCHKTRNDHQAALFIYKLHAKGFTVDTDTIGQCVARMRIAVETGAYPDVQLENPP